MRSSRASGWEDTEDRRQSVTGATPHISGSHWEEHFNSSYLEFYLGQVQQQVKQWGISAKVDWAEVDRYHCCRNEFESCILRYSCWCQVRVTCSDGLFYNCSTAITTLSLALPPPILCSYPRDPSIWNQPMSNWPNDQCIVCMSWIAFKTSCCFRICTVYSCPQLYLAIQALVCIYVSGFAYLYLRTCVYVFVFLHRNRCKPQKYPSIWRGIRSVSRVSHPDHFIPFAAFNWGILSTCGNSLRPCKAHKCKQLLRTVWWILVAWPGFHNQITSYWAGLPLGLQLLLWTRCLACVCRVMLVGAKSKEAKEPDRGFTPYHLLCTMCNPHEGLEGRPANKISSLKI